MDIAEQSIKGAPASSCYGVERAVPHGRALGMEEFRNGTRCSEEFGAVHAGRSGGIERYVERM